MYGGVVVFSLTSRLFEVALELLRSPERRWDIEKNARRFMVADHYRPEVPLFYFEENEYGKKFTQASHSLTRLSSLSLVAKALQRASGEGTVVILELFHNTTSLLLLKVYYGPRSQCNRILKY